MPLVEIVTDTCMVCHNAGVVKDVDQNGYDEWKAGAFIQNALPNLSAGDREQLMTGTHSACFDLLFPEEEDDDDFPDTNQGAELPEQDAEPPF